MQVFNKGCTSPLSKTDSGLDVYKIKFMKNPLCLPHRGTIVPIYDPKGQIPKTINELLSSKSWIHVFWEMLSGLQYEPRSTREPKDVLRDDRGIECVLYFIKSLPHIIIRISKTVSDLICIRSVCSGRSRHIRKFVFGPSLLALIGFLFALIGLISSCMHL